MLNSKHLSLEELEAGLDQIRLSPKDEGRVMLIVRRPAVDLRESVQVAELDPEQGLVGDNWKAHGNKSTPDGSANLNAQITVMNSRAVDRLAQSEERWSLAGDQLYVDMDLSDENLPPGTRLALGTAVIEVRFGESEEIARTGVNPYISEIVVKPKRMEVAAAPFRAPDSLFVP